MKERLRGGKRGGVMSLTTRERCAALGGVCRPVIRVLTARGGVWSPNFRVLTKGGGTLGMVGEVAILW